MLHRCSEFCHIDAHRCRGSVATLCVGLHHSLAVDTSAAVMVAVIVKLVLTNIKPTTNHSQTNKTNRAMKLIADPANHPVAFYCTAGKDRTGIIAALILSAIDTPLDSILDDYTISDDAYKQLGDKDAMVGALRQQDLDSDIFLCAPRSIMADTLALVQSKYGGTGPYLDSVGV
eukprot:12975-Heterococcus_DN1.PRE.2